MTIQVNGDRLHVADGTTVGDVLAGLALTAETRGVAVAVDAEVLPRASWPGTVLTEGARVEVLGAIQGG